MSPFFIQPAEILDGSFSGGRRNVRLVIESKFPEIGMPLDPASADDLGPRLVVGWQRTTRGLDVQSRNISNVLRGDDRQPTIAGAGPDDVFVYGMVESPLSKVVKGQDLAGQVLRSFAAAFACGSDDVARRVSDVIGFVSHGAVDGDREIEGEGAVAWFRNELAPEIAKIPTTTAAKKLRVLGLLSTWGSMDARKALFHALPELFKELKLDQLSGPDIDSTFDDDWFLQRIDFVTGLDPNEVIRFALKNPYFKWMFVSTRLGTPTIETQRMMLSLLDDSNATLRVSVLRWFAVWNGESDKMVNAQNLRNGESVVTLVPREVELRQYWTNKFGGVIKP